MMDDLATHIEKENFGVFPVAVVILGARGWATIQAPDEAEPSRAPTRERRGLSGREPARTSAATPA
jgi:hypothetical protein